MDGRGRGVDLRLLSELLLVVVAGVSFLVGVGVLSWATMLLCFFLLLILELDCLAGLLLLCWYSQGSIR